MAATTTDTMMNPMFRDVIGFGGGQGNEVLPHVRGRQDFRLDDVKVGSSWMAGVTTAGRVAVGCVKGVDLGEGFVIRQRGGQRSKLWQQLWLLEAAPERLASSASGEPRDGATSATPAADVESLPESDAEGETPEARQRPAALDAEESPLKLSRTDSGLDYCMPGYPDCAWWADNWLPTLFVVPAVPTATRQILNLLMDAMENGDVPESGPFREAWDRQVDSCHAALSAAPSVGIAPASEASMAALATAVAEAALPSDDEGDVDGSDTPESLPPLRLPNVSDHIGAGIRPGSFIKPDPHDARAIQRRHILTELRTWLTSRLYGSARLASHTDMTEAEIRDAMATGRGWPGGRLWLLLQTLTDMGRPLPGRPADTGDRLRLAGVWAADVCERYLRDGERPIWTEYQLALGFVTEDRLPDGRTIADLWPRPEDLAALRDASPLPSDADEEAEDEAESPRIETTLRSMDQHIDEIGGLVGQFLTGNVALEFKVRMPGWAWTSLFLTVVGYFWLVAFLLGGGRRAFV